MNIRPELLIPFCPPSKVRLGGAFDGGYAVCPEFVADRLISLGCDNKTHFESAYLSLRPNAKIDIYDPNGKCDLAEQDDRVSFHEKAIQSFDELDMSSPCVVQIDVEGSEKDMILNYNGSFDNVTQLVIEIHFKLKKRPQKKGWNDCLEKLNEHFHLIHIHGNTRSRVDVNAPIPNVIECTYINKKLFVPDSLEPNIFPDCGVDRPNRRNNEQHQLDWWIV